jgi:hypothetical protein
VELGADEGRPLFHYLHAKMVGTVSLGCATRPSWRKKAAPTLAGSADLTDSQRGRFGQFAAEQERKLILLLERDNTAVGFTGQPEARFYKAG